MKLTKTLLSLTAAGALAFGAPALAGDHSHHGHHGDHGKQQETGRTAEGVGVIRAIAADGKSVTLHHEPIRELRWPAMTMDLVLADPKLAASLKEGAKVDFTLQQTGPTDFTIIRIDQAAPAHRH